MVFNLDMLLLLLFFIRVLLPVRLSHDLRSYETMDS